MRWLIGLSLAVLSGAATAQEQPGSGVLCAYVVYSGALLDAEVCGWGDTSAGLAVRQGVADIQSYMLANSSLPERLEQSKANFAQGLSLMLAKSADERATYCEGKDPDRPNYFGAMRFQDPKELTEDLGKLLSRPGEPTYGDCF